MQNKSIDSYLTFRLQNEMFAVSVQKVLEIIETGEEHTITHLPKAPPTISGVVNFRGNVIPVVDTRLKFDLPAYTANDKFVVMILNLKINNTDQFVGAMADKVVDVIEIAENDIKEVPKVGQGYDAEFIKGVINRDNRFIMLLNLEAAMGTDEIVSLRESIDLNSEAENTEIIQETDA